jgi:hypothetical protein
MTNPIKKGSGEVIKQIHKTSNQSIMEEIFKKLRNLYKIDKSREVFLHVIEFFIAVYTGGLIEAWIGSENEFDKKAITIVASIVTIGFLVFRLARQFYLPESTIDYIENKLEIDKTRKEVSRKNTIDEFIDNSIQQLNSNTCDLPSFGGHLCDNPLEKGLASVYDSIIQQTHYLLDTHKSQFTVAVFLKNYINVNDDSTFDRFNKMLVFRDDFVIIEHLTDNMIYCENQRDFCLEIQNCVKKSLNNSRMYETKLNDDLKLITSPIPQVCGGDFNDGTLLIFCENDICVPKDLENVLLIFSRILTNWISKYYECVSSRRQLVISENNPTSG